MGKSPGAPALSVYREKDNVCISIWTMACCKRNTTFFSAFHITPECFPLRGQSVIRHCQCLGSQSERTPTVMKGLVVPVFIPT